MDQHIESEHAAKMLSIEEEGIKNIQEKFRCKITVLRRAFYEDLYSQAPYGAASACGRLKEGQVFRAIDLTEGMMSRAKQRLKKQGLLDRVDFRIADAGRLPFPDSSFNVVYNAYMFDLIDISEFSVILSEFRRVLKRGGKLVLVNMSKNRNTKTLYEWLYEKSLLNFASGSCRPVLLQSFIEEAGFQAVTRTYRKNYSWFFLNWLTGTEIVIGKKAV